MFRNILSESCNDCSVEALDLAAGAGVSCSSSQVVSFQTDSYLRKELEHELWSVFDQQVALNLVQMTQLSTKKVTAFMTATVVTIMALINFVYW